ncbi:MAG: glutathione transferase GstA [Casimicrobiaceae bacterium]|nr:glutathione transferase GstA [Casimicrobiaceae bacterium]MDW8312007.1 glutathione transferase GstA [Burkholderiales bacterium]
MKLFYSSGACSLSPHIVLREAGLPFELVRVNLKTHRLDEGTDYDTINPKGAVPLLELDDGQRLTEGPAIVQYIADQVPQKRLAPPYGSMDRYRLIEWLNFIASDLRMGFWPLIRSKMPEEAKALARERLMRKFQQLDDCLAGREYTMGPAFSVADAYLFTVARWGKYCDVDLSGFARLQAFNARMMARPAVQAARIAEGLLTPA